MRHKHKLLLLFFFVFVCGEAFPQEFTAGIHSGLNLSDIHNNSISGKWKFKPGPYQGAFLTWNINRILGIKAGLDYSTLYYEHVNANPYYPPVIYSLSSSYMPTDLWWSPETFDYNMLSLPLQVQLKVPSKPDLYLAAGVFYSFVSQKKIYGKSSETDFGYIFSSGWSLALSESFKGIMNVSYMTGRRVMTDYGIFRNGSFNFSAGVGYNFGKVRNIYHEADSIGAGLKIVYLGGLNTSWNGADDLPGSYSMAFGPVAGFRLEIPVEKHVYFITGLTFERTGYSVKDSSDVTYAARTVKYSSAFIDTRTGIDYMTIPALFHISPGRNERFYLNTGPYISIRLNARTTGKSYSELNAGSMYQYIRNTVYNDEERLFKGNDSGWSFGAGLNFHMLGLSWQSGLEYRRGFRNVFDASTLPANERSTYSLPVRNRTLSVHLGMKIPAKRRSG
ncbi:MAG TPA: porin family protein [Bacteroidales bacterium]|nr:porin family protein [Bacteroidales bacterium]